jgi:fumarate reductase subunit D
LADCVIAKLAVLGIVAMSLWSSAHRLRCTCFDFGLRMDGFVATVLYVGAIVASIATAMFLFRI